MKETVACWRLLALTVYALIVVSCTPAAPAASPLPPATQSAVPVSPPPTKRAPPANGPASWPTAGWRSSTPAAQGMDAGKLAKMIGFIEEQAIPIHSVTIIRNGTLVADATFYPFDGQAKHVVHSVTKSITSALIGMAIEQGAIEDVQQPVLSFFPGRTVANRDANKEAMTLEHLLTMTSGLECRDSYLYRWRGLERMRQTDDWVQFMLDLPMIAPPGSKFEYCNGASFLLSAIIQETTGMEAADFAAEHLFGPLGITDFAWPANPQGISIGWGELRLRPQDMAKIGLLYLNEGEWEGEQIIPAAWVAASTRPFTSATLSDSYGYQWWIDDAGYRMALGYAGQYIVVVPEQDLVVVFTSNLAEDDFAQPEILLDIFILPAVLSDAPLAADPAARAELAAASEQAAQPPPAAEPGPLPALARRISGRSYALDPNPMGLTAATLTFEQEAEASLQLVSQETGDEPALVQAYPVGLDGNYRFAPGDFDIPMGIKGAWPAEDRFVVDFDFIGNTGEAQAAFTFSGEQVRIQIVEYGQRLPELTGELRP